MLKYRKDNLPMVEQLTALGFSTILVPIDGSISCLRAQELAAFIAKKFHSRITVVHVISHDFMHPELKAHHQLPPLILQKIDEVYTKSGERILKTAEEALKDEDLEVESLLIRKSEDPADTILNLAKERRFELIVIGNRAETQAERYELGSVTEKVALYSKSPVLIVKRKTRLTKILVAIDGSKQAAMALDYASILANTFKSKITLINVEESKLASLEPEAVEQIGEAILSEAATRAKRIQFEKRLEFGSPAEKIIEVANQGNYDLIVLGSRGLSSIKRYLLGSVSEDVSMHSRRSVLIVR